MTRVLLFAPLYPPYSGGSPTYFSNLIDSLSEEHSFLVVTAYHPDEPVVMESSGNTIYRVIPFYQSLPNPIRLVLESLTAFAVTLYSILFHSIELAHIHATSYASPAIAVTASIADVPIIYDCQDLSFPPWIVNIGSKPLVFSCAPNVDNLLKQQGVPENRIVRMPIVNPEYVSEYANENEKMVDDISEKFTVIYVGNLRKFKGVGMLLESFEEFAKERDDVKLQLIGDGPYKSTLQKHVSKSNLKEEVDFMGEIDHREALQYISCADVLVHPSARETGPRSVTEAIELGTTVIATPVGIVPEVIDDGQTGLITDRTVDSVTKSLSLLYDNHVFRSKLSENAVNRDGRPKWTDIAEEISRKYCRYD